MATALLLPSPAAAIAPTGPTPAGDRFDRGARALDRLGDRLPRVAARYDLSRQELRHLMLTDRSVGLDDDERLLYVDPPAAADTPAPGAANEPPRFALADTFSLHSAPGSTKVIYLDFDGAVVSGTEWNADGVSTAAQPAYSKDGDPAFSESELASIQRIWQWVAQDYAPFNVDVTTEDPGSAAIHRTDASDQSYGTRVLVTPSSQASSALCTGGCGGIAFVGSFNETGSEHTVTQPAWVFPQSLSTNDKYIAEAASHEAGHNLGLSHDGVTGGPGYYSGHAMWAPIMGVGYTKPVSQWSRGEYAGASNTQDDVAIISSHGAPIRHDEAGESVANAAALSGAGPWLRSGVIAARADRDTFSFTAGCDGPVTVTASPEGAGTNLDIRLRLLGAGGAELASADPPAAMSNYLVATGLDASVTAVVTAGTYYAQVDGVGFGNASTGYTDYGSLGGYSLAVSESCSPMPPPNDDLADAWKLGGFVAAATGSNGAATEQLGEGGGSGVRQTIWWAWTAPDTGMVTVSTDRSSVPASGCVYAGGQLADLVEVGCVGGSDSGTGLRFAAHGDTTYLIQLDGVDDQVGNLAVDLVMRQCGGHGVTVDLAFGDPMTSGRDVIRGTTAGDLITAQGGSDLICGRGGGDTIAGGGGNDLVIGGGGDDHLRGGTGADDLRGTSGHDRFAGGFGTDRCTGGLGRDVHVDGCEIRHSVP